MFMNEVNILPPAIRSFCLFAKKSLPTAKEEFNILQVKGKVQVLHLERNNPRHQYAMEGMILLALFTALAHS